jgi:hypothetical protein
MRDDWLHLEFYRFKHKLPDYQSQFGDKHGCFILQHPKTKAMLRMIVSNGDYKAARVGPEYAWEHVSVSIENRCPTWEEMDYVKDLFWKPDECVMQLHVPKAEHKNCHQYCLHLWRPLETTIPRPPVGAV